ncbi:MAG: 5-(carboxyamino)imidazole ribonucleotide mutase [Chloroflexi bacterium]|nr:5-(carboxyamino)imidazole ribonucleotide mutase [Chloroflexota bacterium]
MRRDSLVARPVVGIVVGSESDLPTMKKAVEVLDSLGVPFEMCISSAHRLPNETYSYACGARERGLKVLIAGAGMAAHLPGVLAAHTTLPVVGVPLASGALKGVDSLYSIVQMPSGIPVAAVAIDGAKNAAYLACQILAAHDESLARRLEEEREKQRRKLNKRNRELGFISS